MSKQVFLPILLGFLGVLLLSAMVVGEEEKTKEEKWPVEDQDGFYQAYKVNSKKYYILRQYR